MSSSAFSTSIVSTSRASSSALRHRNQSSSFIHDSYNASLDFPTYIPWQTLSTDVMTELRQGSVKINRSNKIEWADTIKEEAEKTPLLDRRKLTGSSEESSISDAVSGGKDNLVHFNSSKFTSRANSDSSCSFNASFAAASSRTMSRSTSFFVNPDTMTSILSLSCSNDFSVTV